MTKMDAITQEFAQAHISSTLSLYIGRGRKHTLEEVAAATDIPPRTLQSYLGGQATPGFANMWRLMAVLNPTFADSLLAPIGLAALSREDKGVADFALNADVASMINRLGGALADGRIDHRERETLKPFAQALGHQLLAWAKQK